MNCESVMKILVVDDDVAVRESVRKVLHDEGYETVLAADGKEALKQFVSQPIDLMVLDLGLPFQTGWDVFEHITHKNPLLPIIVITGQSEQYKAAAAAGVGALMEKPLDAGELLRVIAELLAEPKEVRLQRLTGHGGELRHIPARNAEFLKHLREQHEKPYEFKLPRH